uniref:Uncharacterized protein n=1 Tax=Anguilla anguilla TaxID=7936 RepID=A0A0E9P6D6_ANGAN
MRWAFLSVLITFSPLDGRQLIYDQNLHKTGYSNLI